MPGGQLQPDDADEQKSGCQHAPDIGGIPEPQDTRQKRAQRTNARPHRISGADGNASLGQPQEKAAQGHAEYGKGNAGGKSARTRAGRLGKLEAQRPSDLTETGQHQINPGHILKGGIIFRSPAFPNGKSSKGNGCLVDYLRPPRNQAGNAGVPCHIKKSSYTEGARPKYAEETPLHAKLL